MAKKFLGFNPEQKYTLLSKLGYEGPKDSKMMELYLNSNPSAAGRMSDYGKRAQEMLTGTPTAMAEGGVVTTPTTTSTTAPAPATLDEAQAQAADATKAFIQNPEDTTAINNLGSSQVNLAAAQKAYNLTEVPSSSEAISTAIKTPQNLVVQATPQKVVTTPDQLVAEGTGQAGVVKPVTAVTAAPAAQATAPEKVDAATVDTTIVGDKVEQKLEGLQAATAQPSKAATVQGQLETLMTQFEGGATPPWASGPMRQAMGIMQQRGLGASSIAGQAVVQAAMESALAIASQDASTTAQFEMQNLNNEQQTAIFKTQQMVAGMFTDQAAENASKQFNAASKNQVNQFFAGLQESVSRFNADQINGISQFNAGQENVVEQFNSSLAAQRDQFNAQNSLIIAQANAQWRQNIATLDTAAANEANMLNAKTANALTQSAVDQIWQRERDLMNFAFTSSENQAARDISLILADKEIQAKVNLQNSAIDYQDSVAKYQTLTNLAGMFF